MVFKRYGIETDPAGRRKMLGTVRPGRPSKVNFFLAIPGQPFRKVIASGQLGK
jgi:hypothetical protein